MADNMVTVDPQSLDAEMYAVAMCIEGLEPLKDKPYSLMRVIQYIGSRYVDNLKQELARFDAEIKVVNERLAQQKYDALEKGQPTDPDNPPTSETTET